MFEIELKDKINQIEDVITAYLPREEGLQKTVIEAMNYSVLAGGKRLRPLLMRETFKLFNGDGQIVEPFMAAIEMIHTYSLVHDDLPAMDNDMYRRGKLTTHAKYGETMGILAGDGLLNLAFEVAATAFDISCDKNCARALSILAKNAGIYGMIGGQVVDIESENTDADISTLNFIHENKTGALIAAAMTIGAVLAGASEYEVDKIEKIAYNIGIAFQIQDDVLDVISTTEELGKPVGSDEKNHKVTYVTLVGLEESQKQVKKMTDEAIELLHSLEFKNQFLEDLLIYLIDRKK